MPDRPNVIVIVSDTFRPDHLGANGHPVCRTPELDRFVARALTFDQAYVSSFPTIPMRTDWFTGRFSHTRHGWQDLDPTAITLPHLFNRAGYTTQLIADTTHMLRAKFWQPFKHFHFLRGHEADTPLSRLNDPITPVISDRRKTRVEYGNTGDRPVLCDHHAHTNFRQRYEAESHIALLADTLCHWLEDNYRAGPFLLWMDCFDVHEPWFPPEYLWRSYQADYDGEPMVHPNYHTADAYTSAELANLNARYNSMCTLLSKHVGRVLRVIEDSGLLERSVVCFLSDHGMYLGERGRTGKTLITADSVDNFPFFCELTRICWSMHVPPGLAPQAPAPGTRLQHLIQAPDLMPTLLDLCGVALPDNLHLEGHSLGPVLRGETTDGPRRLAVTSGVSGTALPGVERQRLFCRRPTVTDGEWTLLVGDPPDPQPARLFRQDDLRQERDLLGECPGEARRLHRQMLDWLREHELPAEGLERLAAENCGL